MHRPFALLPLLVLGLAIAACDGDPTGVDGGGGTDGGPGGTDAGLDAGPGDAGTDAGPIEDAGSDAGSTDVDAALPPGACSNAEDGAVLMTIDVAMEARTCGNMCFGGAGCVTRCMEGVGLSTECATCFGSVAQCTVRNCALDCSGSDEAACTACRVMAGCVSAFEACSGLPGT